MQFDPVRKDEPGRRKGGTPSLKLCGDFAAVIAVIEEEKTNFLIRKLARPRRRILREQVGELAIRLRGVARSFLPRTIGFQRRPAPEGEAFAFELIFLHCLAKGKEGFALAESHHHQASRSENRDQIVEQREVMPDRPAAIKVGLKSEQAW